MRGLIRTYMQAVWILEFVTLTLDYGARARARARARASAKHSSHRGECTHKVCTCVYVCVEVDHVYMYKGIVIIKL